MDLEKIYRLAQEDKVFSNKISDEEAYKIFRDIRIDIAHCYDPITRETIQDFQDVLLKIARGQIVYDKATGIITFKLTVPVKVGDETVTSLTFKKPSLHQLREGKVLIKELNKTSEVSDDILNKLISMVTESTSAVVTDLQIRDFYIAGHISSLFFL